MKCDDEDRAEQLMQMTDSVWATRVCVCAATVSFQPF